eukprot:2435301-Rhodomonas_salina.1
MSALGAWFPINASNRVPAVARSRARTHEPEREPLRALFLCVCLNAPSALGCSLAASSAPPSSAPISAPPSSPAAPLPPQARQTLQAVVGRPCAWLLGGARVRGCWEVWKVAIGCIAAVRQSAGSGSKPQASMERDRLFTEGSETSMTLFMNPSGPGAWGRLSLHLQTAAPLTTAEAGSHGENRDNELGWRAIVGKD